MIILGLDPGTARTGFGVIQKNNDDLKMLDFGSIETSKKLPFAERLYQISKDLEIIIKKWRPDSSAIEKIFFTKNVKTAIDVAHARGVLMQILTKHKIPIFCYTPTQVKSGITSYGKADKLQVQTMTKIILNLQEIPKPDDAADALAIAVCHSSQVLLN
jgi:crossover junction endodeoxyribonuclease RuvC